MHPAGIGECEKQNSNLRSDSEGLHMLHIFTIVALHADKCGVKNTSNYINNY